MRVQGQLMWLAHILPAVALTITAPVQTTPSSAPVSGCSSVNLIEDVAFETIDLDESVWTVLPPKGGVAVDGYLHLSPKSVQSQTMLVQTVTGATAEESYTLSFGIRQTADSNEDTTPCAVNIMLGGDEFVTSTHSTGGWTTISQNWMAVSSEIDVFLVIDCPNAIALGTTVDVKNVSLKKTCGSSSETSVSVPIKTPSVSVSPSSQPTAPGSSSSSIHTVTVSIPSSHSSSVHVSHVSPSSTGGPITLTTIVTGPANTASSSAIESSASSSGAPASSESTTLTTTITEPANTASSSTIESSAPSSEASASSESPTLTSHVPTGPTTSSPVVTAPPEMTTSTVFTTRTSTITACPSTVTHCPVSEQTTYTTTETIVVSTTVCPVEDATTTEGPSPTSSSSHGNGNGSGNGSVSDNDYTVSTILSTRTVTLTECPATVTDCPARDQTTHVTTETVVAGTTSVPIHTEVTTTAPGAVQTTAGSHVGGNGPDSGVSEGEGEGSTGSGSGSGSGPDSGSDSGSGSGSGSGSDVSAGNGAGHVSHLPGITRISAAPSFSLTRISSATVNVPHVAVPSPTTVNAGAGTSATTGSSNPPSTSPVFNGASSFGASSGVSALGAIFALALFL